MIEKQNLEDIIKHGFKEPVKAFKLYMYGGLIITALIVILILTTIIKLILV